MADKKKQGVMVLHEEGMAAPTLAPPPTSAAALFVVLKQMHPGESVQDKGSLLAISEPNNMVKSTISSGATGIHSTSSTSPSDTSTHLENLPADARCKGITVTLDNNSMWNEFSRCQTEMILTKQGRRMFPCCRFRLSGMEPFQSYLLAMDIVPVDNYRYKWSGKGWEPNGKADPHVSRLFVHPESPATGLHWMQCPVSFYRLKLCNNTLDQEGHIILHSMHRYLPRLHIIPADKSTGDIHIDRPEVITLSFSQTEFFAVTAYQNLSITQLKIDYNPFAKGFREDAVNARSTKAKNGIFTEETETELKLSRETTTLNNLRSLFMKRSAAAKVIKDQNVPSPTNGERKLVNGDALVVERDKSTKKRPLPGAFSDFLKGAHVKVKRLTLDNIQKNGLVLQTDTPCTSGKQEALAESSKPENVLQVGETVMDDNHQCNNTDTCSKAESIHVDENKMVIDDEHKDDNITLLSSDQKVRNTDENRKENLCSLDSEAKPEAKTNKTLQHKRPEPVPLPLLAQFLKQRQSKTRSITPKPEAPLNSKPHLTPESSTDLISSTPSANTHIDKQQSLTLLSQTVTSSTTTTSDANNVSSTSTTSLSSTRLIADPFILVETQKPLKKSSSPSVSDPFPPPNTTSPVKLDDDPEMDSISSIFGNADGDSMQSLDNIICLDISSVFPCDDLPDTQSPTIPDVNTDAITPVAPTVTTSNSCFDVLPSKNSEVITGVIPNQELTPEPQVVETESVSDVLLESSSGLSPELLPQDVPPDTLSTHDESLSLPLDEPSSPAFSLPSPAPSSPDPFPPDLFSDRAVPPRKTLDSFPERLLDCTGLHSSDLFTLGLYGDIHEPPRNSLEGGLLNGQVALTDLSPMESGDLLSERPCAMSIPDSVHDIQSAVNCERSKTTTVSDQIVSQLTKQSSHEYTLKKSNKKLKKIGKLKHSQDDEAFERPVPAPMQPSLEDVEGQLFVSFMSKTALEIHLGDDAKNEVVQKTFENSEGENCGTIEENIKMLEKELLHDLQLMKHRQVIHPVLQEVGLKLNLLDVTLEIDLKYLGVQLPIPPPVLLSKTSSVSSQDQFVSRTGKTTDFTKIKGWRDKFVGSKSQSEGASSVDAGQNNLSAFCSDMLDEYLASEGKLIDERAANLSQTDTTHVAYQLPTKSTSYVRTLDSVLKNKKQVPTSLSSTSIHPPSTSKKLKPMYKTKVTKKHKNGIKSNTGKESLSTTNPVSSGDKFPVSLKKPQQSKKYKIKKESNSLNAKKLTEETTAVVACDKTPKVEVSGSTAVSCTNGRSPGLPKTLVKLMDVEDGAVWEGKRRTYITEERAAIALTALVTVEGVSKGNPDVLRIIKRRAPPCLNVFCRLGCVCASLLHMRRHHHCGKPECMLGCSCLRRKVVALKNPKEEEITTKEPKLPGLSENKAKWKKNKMRKTYILTDPIAAPEPAKRINKLWDRKGEDFDSEIVFSPPPERDPSPPLLTKELQQDLESAFSPQKKNGMAGRNLNFEEDNDMESNQTCSRVRPFRWRCHNKQKTSVDQHQLSQAATQDIEEGELVPANMSGPVKRLEIISECRWSSTNSRNLVMKKVCEYMAQDRLKKPFWIDNYHIQPVSKTIQGTEEGPVHIYKVIVSQPTGKDTDNETISQSEEESRQPVKRNDVKGQPFLSGCSPAGMLKAEIKTSNAPGQIMVNGKVYPQAKLELGKMGALHPANRLAAYITGRICPVSQSGSSVVTTTASTKNTSTTASITSVAAVTSVTSTSPSTTTSLKTPVTNPPVGPVFTQFVVNHINSQNLSSTSTPHLQPSPPKIIIPSSLLMAGVPSVALSPLKAGLTTQVSESTGSNNLPTVSKVQAPPTITIYNKSPSLPLGGSSITPTVVSPSGSSPTSGKKVVITVVSRNIAATSSGPQITKSVTQVSPSQTPGQRMVLQVVKTADGNTLYRNANGQLVQLVPLSQIKSMNSNILSKGPTTLYHLPTPQAVSPNKLQSVTTTPVTSSTPTSLTQPRTIITVQAPTSLSGKTVTLNAPKSISFSSLPSTIKVTPSFLGQTGTCTLRILPPNAVKDAGIATPTSSSQGGFTLLKPLSSTPQNQESPKTIVSATSDSTDSPVSQVKGLLDLSKPTEIVSAVNTCDNTKMPEHTAEDTSQLPPSAATSPKPTQCSGDGSSPPHTEPGQQECSGLAANPSLKETELDSGKEEGGISSDESELTDDSDLYSEDDEDDTDSDSYIEDLTVDVDSKVKEVAEVEVDIENFEESTEKINIELLRRSARKNNQLQCSLPEDVIERNKIKKVNQERARRCSLRERFHNLNSLLKNPSKQRSKNSILTLCQEEIESLVRQEQRLIKKNHKLENKRDRYLQMLSMLSDKSIQSISQKVKEISAKQKAVEARNQVGEMKSKQLKQRRPKLNTKPNNFPKLIDTSRKAQDLVPAINVNNVSNPTHSPSKPMDLSLKKQRNFETSDGVIEVDSTSKPKELDGSKNTSTIPVKEKSNTSNPIQLVANSTSVPVPIPIKHSSIQRTKTRPNILSRSQITPVSPVKDPLVTNVSIPQVIPLVNTMVPCNQIITLNKPLQPIGITSLGPQHSTTPGVASVCISMPQSLGVENPLPMFQPQFINISNSPVKVNTHVESINLPNIANVISLVPPVNSLVVPQQVVLKQIDTTTAVQAQPTYEDQKKPHPLSEEREAGESQPKDLPKQPAGGDIMTTSNQHGSDKKSQEDSNDPEDENLMSLLDELVLLSQQLSNDSPEPTNEDEDIMVPGEESLQSDHQVDMDRDDDRALSPLFLTLDEDLMSPDSSKDEIDDIPPKVDDLVKVIFGSDSPSISSESGVTNVHSPQPPTSNVASDGLIPPPLLHMKAASGAVSVHPTSEEVTWRPMPKLVPLGLKTQDAIVNKVMGSD